MDQTKNKDNLNNNAKFYRRQSSPGGKHSQVDHHEKEMSALIMINNSILQGIPKCKLYKMQISEVAVCLFVLFIYLFI